MYSVICLISAVVAGILVFFLADGVTPTPGTPVEAAVYKAECSAHKQCGSKPGNCCPSDVGVLDPCCSSMDSTADLAPFQGICYTPAPAKQPTQIPTDDYMGTWAEALWGSHESDRDDLGTIKKLGANMVRLYGNDPRLDHTAFLDRAFALGIGVIVAFSDFPYTQAPRPGSPDFPGCATAQPYNCVTAIQAQYEQMLQHGFTIQRNDGTRQYHAAIKAIVLVNEPELKFSFQHKTNGESRSKGYYAKAMISAFDGALSAEEGLNIVPDSDGKLPPFTITHSFSLCETCLSNTKPHQNFAGSKPVGQASSVAFMYDFVLGCLSPSLYGYATPSNDLRHGLQNRFVLGFNTQDISSVICNNVLTHLAKSPLQNLPIISGEFKAKDFSYWKSPTKDFKDDLQTMVDWTQGKKECTAGYKQMRGFSVFEFQVAYWKAPGAGFEQQGFGIYELGSKLLGKTTKAENTKWQEYDVWCLHQKLNSAQDSWVQALAQVFGGAVPDDTKCLPPFPQWHPPALNSTVAWV